MNSIATFNALPTLETLVPNVFSTMANLIVELRPEGNTKLAVDRVSGTIGIAGEVVVGAVYVHLPEALARLIANALLGNPPGEPVSDGDLNDVVGELTNMIGGGFKSALCDVDRPCAMSTPSIIRGAYAIEVPKDLRVEVSHFNCQGHEFAVEVHLKLD